MLRRRRFLAGASAFVSVTLLSACVGQPTVAMPEASPTQPSQIPRPPATTPVANASPSSLESPAAAIAPTVSATPSTVATATAPVAGSSSPMPPPTALPSVSATPIASAGPAPTATALASAAGTKCVLAPQQTEGPYYLDTGLIRSDITDGKPGVPLTLTLGLLNVAGCQPVEGARVEIWHSDALGVYSGVGGQQSGGGALFLRGGQISDAKGTVTFRTIYPGWYQGRTVHIHVKVTANGRTIHVGQLYFDDAVTDEVAKIAPYSTRAGARVTNENDGPYRNGGAQSTVDARRTGDGYDASMVLGVRV